MHIHTALCTIYYSISLELKKKTNKGGAFFIYYVELFVFLNNHKFLTVDTVT